MNQNVVEMVRGLVGGGEKRGTRTAEVQRWLRGGRPHAEGRNSHRGGNLTHVLRPVDLFTSILVIVGIIAAGIPVS